MAANVSRWIYRSIVSGTMAVLVIPLAYLVSDLLWPLWAAAIASCFYCNYRARMELRGASP